MKLGSESNKEITNPEIEQAIIDCENTFHFLGTYCRSGSRITLTDFLHEHRRRKILGCSRNMNRPGNFLDFNSLKSSFLGF